MSLVKVTAGLSVIVGKRLGLDPVDVFQIGRLCEDGYAGDAIAVFGRARVADVLRELAA